MSENPRLEDLDVPKILQDLKAAIDLARRQNKLYAIEELMKAALDLNMANKETFEQLGFNQGVAAALEGLCNGTADLGDFLEAWEG